MVSTRLRLRFAHNPASRISLATRRLSDASSPITQLGMQARTAVSALMSAQFLLNLFSAGKHKGGKTTKGNVYLRAAFAEVTWCLSRMKENYLSAQHHRFARRMVKPKAAVASSQSLAVVVYHVLKKKQPSQDLGPTYLDALNGERTTKQAVKRLEALGYDVNLTPMEVSVN